MGIINEQPVASQGAGPGPGGAMSDRIDNSDAPLLRNYLGIRVKPNTISPCGWPECPLCYEKTGNGSYIHRATASDELVRRGKEIKKLTAVTETMRESIDDRDKKIAGLEGMLSGHKFTIDSLSKQLDEKDASIREREQEIKELKARNDRQAAELRRLRDASFHDIKFGGWIAAQALKTDADDLAARLDKLTKRVDDLLANERLDQHWKSIERGR